MKEAFARTALQLGEEAVERLAAARVAVFGIGGVGGYAVEALARSGIGTLDLIDTTRLPSPISIDKSSPPIIPSDSTKLMPQKSGSSPSIPRRLCILTAPSICPKRRQILI